MRCTMTLREWRESSRLTLAACAQKLGAANGEVVWKWETRRAIPRRAAMLRIWVETRGQVDANAFYDLPPLAAEACEAAA